MRAAAILAGVLLGGGVLLVALALYLSLARPVEGAGLSASTVLEDLIDQVTLPLGSQGRATRTAAALSRANINLRPQEWYVIRLLVPVVVFLVAEVIQPLLGVSILLAIGAFFLPGVLLRVRRNQRRTELQKQLPEALQVMSNALETGASVLQSIQAVAEGMRPPIGAEFVRIDREIQLGLSLDDTLDRVAVRVDSRDLSMVVSAIEINREMGGSLAEVLDSISGTMRERVRLKERIRVMTAQVRLSSRVITVLPFAVAAFLLLFAPAYMAPLFTHVVGYVAILIAIALAGLAYFIMANITNIEL